MITLGVLGVIVLFVVVAVAAVASVAVLVYKNNQKKADAVIAKAQGAFNKVEDKAKDIADAVKK